jgi:TBC1 domain family member 6
MSLEGSKVDLGVLMASLEESMPGIFAKVGGELEESPEQPKPVSRPGARYATLGRKNRRPKPTTARSADAMGPASVDRLPPITLCMTAWFMSCFIGTLPIETTLRVWDVFFYEGSRTLFRVALAIFKLGEGEIRAVQDPMEMFGVVQALPRRLLDCNMVMDATFKRRNGFGHLSQESIEDMRRERREALKAARKATSLDDSEVKMRPDVTDILAVDSVRRKGTLFGRRKERGAGH